MSARLLLAVLMVATHSAGAAELGRLFFTPAQRAALDVARKQNVRVDIGNEDNEKPAVAAAAPTPRNVSVNGLIQRSDGNNPVWLNNKPVSSGNAAGVNISTRKGDTGVKLSVPDSGRSVDLKVGQTVEILSGTVEEGFRRRNPLKIEEKPATAADNNAQAVQKRTAEPATDSIESSSRLQRKPRAGSRDAQDEARAGGTDNR